MNGCCPTCRGNQAVSTFPGVLTPDQAGEWIAAHPGMAVSLGGLVARVVWSASDTGAADEVAAVAATHIHPPVPGRGEIPAGDTQGANARRRKQ